MAQEVHTRKSTLAWKEKTVNLRSFLKRKIVKQSLRMTVSSGREMWL